MMNSNTEPIKNILTDAFDEISYRYINQKNNSTPFGISTGFRNLDTLLNGLHHNELTILTGITNQLDFALQIVLNITTNENEPVIIFSKKINKIKLLMKILAIQGEIDFHKIETGEISNDSWIHIDNAMRVLSNTLLYICDDPLLTTKKFESECEKYFKRFRHSGLIIIDNFDMVENESKYNNIEIFLKKMSIQYHTHIIAIKDFKSAYETDDNGIPYLSKLDIIKHADNTLFISNIDSYKNQKKLTVAKMETGNTGSVNLEFIPECSKFKEL